MWLYNLPCCSLWCNCITPNFWCCWSIWCNEHIRKLGITIIIFTYVTHLFPLICVEFNIYIYICLQDKLGPFCRSAADCTIILDAILGKDPNDLSSIDISLDDPFSVDITNLTVGYLDDAEMEVRVSLYIRI